MTPAVEVFAPTGDVTGEGIVWSAEENALYWVDINRFLLHRADHASRAVQTFLFDEPVTAAALTDRPGTLLLALASRLVLFEPATGTRRDQGYRLPGFPKARFNDGRPDPAGRFLAGTMGNNVLPDGENGEVEDGLGQLLSIDSAGRAVTLAEGLGIANTICFSPDGTRFYSADTLKNEIRVYAFDRATGGIASPKPFFAGFGRGSPDGSAMDSAGYLWNARYGGGCVVRIAPDGTVERVVEVPAEAVTTCTFGGPDLRTLFITTGTSDRKPGQRLAGSVFSLAVETPGLPENRFRL